MLAQRPTAATSRGSAPGASRVEGDEGCGQAIVFVTVRHRSEADPLPH